MKKILKETNQKGITLVALVITIIIVLILAGISIQALTNQGLFAKAEDAKKASEIANIKEKIQLDIYQKQLEPPLGTITDEELKGILNNYGDIIYEADGVTIKGIKTKIGGYEMLLSEIYSGGSTEEALLADGSWQKGKGVNSPEILTGMTPIKFTDPTDSTEGTTVTTTTSDSNWYNYDAKKWANAKTQDGSMWVWIPRYAYKITYYTDENKTTISNSKTQYGSVDVKFLIGKTDNYYDENGVLQKAKRQETLDQTTIDTTTGYTVHPAFTNESSIKYANGGWNKELSGIWVAKFEAGYATGNNTTTKADGTAYTKTNVPASSVKYTQTDAYVSGTETGTGDGMADARNWLDGTYGSTETYIKYPTFQGTTYSMNYINHNDAYNLSKVLTENNNIYGLNSSNADSHLMKNSEWGAVTYLSQSKYGLNGTNIYVNNVNLNSSTTSVYAVTGCATAIEDAKQVVTTINEINNRTASNVYVWTQKNGQKASATGTIYGIYDMSGGILERTAEFVANGNESLIKYGSSLINAVTKINGASTTYESIPYVTVYPSNDSGITDYDTASTNNYAVNTKIYGDAIRETSTEGTGQKSWYSDYSYFAGYGGPLFARGGNFWSRTGAGLFSFNRYDGNSYYDNGFRAVLVAQ